MVSSCMLTRRGVIGLVEKLLSVKGLDVNARDEWGRQPLHEALTKNPKNDEKNHKDIAKFLV